jgi:hypothetical protein
MFLKCCPRRFYQDTVLQLADALGWGVVVLHDAKGMFPEDHPAFLGTYSPFYTDPVSVKQCYEAADALLFIGEQLLVPAIFLRTFLAAFFLDHITRHATTPLCSTCCGSAHPPWLEHRDYSNKLLLCDYVARTVNPAGTHFNEMNMGGPPDAALELKSVLAYKSHVLVSHTEAFSGVTAVEFVKALAG